MPTPTTPSLGSAFLNGAWIFQAIIASPILLNLGFLSFITIYDGYSSVYDFVLFLGNTILAAALIFIVLIQRKLQPELFLRTTAGKLLGFRLEVLKSVLATGLWLWILLDAIFGPCRGYGCNEFYQRRRILSCGIASILLVLFWYPPVVYTGYIIYHSPVEGGEEEEGGERQDAGEGEDAPLLGNERV